MLQEGRTPGAVVWLAALAVAGAGAGCATRSVDVAPVPVNAADFLGWPCPEIDDELDRVQQRAAEVAWDVDQRAGNNVLALGVGLAVFWPALLAMRPAGADALELARLKGRHEALHESAAAQGCAVGGPDLPPQRRQALPVVEGERLIYADRRSPRQAASEWTLTVQALRRGEIEYLHDTTGIWRQDRAGNVLMAPDGALHWPHLLRRDLQLGQVLAGDILVAGDPQLRARMRGQVVAVGPQALAAREFDVAVIELFGDTQLGDTTTRVDGVIVVDRRSGMLLRLDLSSAQPAFTLQRRLERVEAAP